MQNKFETLSKKVNDDYSLFEATHSDYLLVAEENRRANSNPTKHTVLFHGWGNNMEDLKNWKQKLIDENIEGWIWTSQYDTGKSFDDVGLHFYNEFRKKEQEGFVFNDVRILAYSMGGLVARKLISLGFEVNCMVSVCSPHEGLMNEIPAINDGVKSLKKNSTEILSITNNSIDIENRYKYVFTGFKYHCTGNNTFFDNDTVVDLYSALGDNLEELSSRNALDWGYPKKNGPIWYTDNIAPHRLPLREEYTNDSIGYLIKYLI